MTTMLVIPSSSPEETITIGRMLAGLLAPGDMVAMVGQLGAGKTQLTKGIALGLGVPDARLVSSPTFVLCNEYEGRIPVYHIDAYRLGGSSELEALGFEEMTATGVVLVEWADRVQSAIVGQQSSELRNDCHALWIELTITGNTSRTLTLSTESSRFAAALANLGMGE